MAGLDRLFRPGFVYGQPEILLLDLRKRGEFTDDLFAETQPAVAERVMDVLDEINAKWGRGALRRGRVPTAPDWGMKREMMSPSYTTRWDQLWMVKAM